ncbi:hypothetical protein B0H11DRAFT_2326851, partial [Mycena galericulata]
SDTGLRVQAGTVANTAKKLSDQTRAALKQYYNREEQQVSFPREETPGTSALHSFAETYNYALLDGRRITPIDQDSPNSKGSSIIQARFGDLAQAGELREIFVHRQPGVRNSGSTLLASVAWMKNSPYSPLDNTKLWDALQVPELSVNTWEFGKFLDPASSEMPGIIQVGDIHCQVARGTLTHTTPRLWITTSMDR